MRSCEARSGLRLDKRGGPPARVTTSRPRPAEPTDHGRDGAMPVGVGCAAGGDCLMLAHASLTDFSACEWGERLNLVRGGDAVVYWDAGVGEGFCVQRSCVCCSLAQPKHASGYILREPPRASQAQPMYGLETARARGNTRERERPRRPKSRRRRAAVIDDDRNGRGEG